MNLALVKTDQDYIKVVAEMIWKYCRHHKNQAIEYGKIRDYLLKNEKATVSNEVQNAAIKLLVKEQLIHEVTHGVWRVSKQTTRSKQAEETFKALSESIIKKETKTELPEPVAAAKLINPVSGSNISLILEYINENPGASASEARAFFKGIINTGTVGPTLLDLAERGLIRLEQVYKEVSMTHRITKKPVPMQRKINTYYPLNGAVPVPKEPTPKREEKTATVATLSFEVMLNNMADVVTKLNSLGIHEINIKMK